MNQTTKSRYTYAQVERMTQSELLACSVSDLELSLTNAGLDRLTRQLERELLTIGLPNLTPTFYLSDEWYCPADSIHIAIPFYLAHPRLTRLEKRYRKRVEGDQKNWFMQLMRHEAGHAFDHAYGISDQMSWKRIFGDKNKPYNTERYRFDPTSPDFVNHLPDHYAQCHPEEDYAETFAVVMTPRSNWRYIYRNSPKALRKLSYVAGLIAKYGNKSPLPSVVRKRPTVVASRMRRKLSTHYGLEHR